MVVVLNSRGEIGEREKGEGVEEEDEWWGIFEILCLLGYI